MTLSSPLATIGIICFNAEDTVEVAIKSALNQTWQNKEIIIIDDCSTDKTVPIVESLISCHENIHLFVNRENQGVAHNRNLIITNAKGDFITFFDDDDFSFPERVQKQISKIIDTEKKFGPAICHTARLQHYADNSSRTEPTINHGYGKEVANRILFGKPLKSGSIGSLATCSQAARKTSYITLEGFDEEFRRCEDTDFAVRAALADFYFVGINTPLVEQTMTCSSDKNLQEEKKHFFMLLNKHKNYLCSVKRYNHCLKWLETKFSYYEGHKILFAFKLMKLIIRNPIKTAQRIVWSLPNTRFNIKFKEYKSEK